MLKDMLADYDHTKEAFDLIVKAAVAEIKCREELKEELRKAAEYVSNMEWNVARASAIDTLFLGWLCAEKPGWLNAPEPIDHYLPRSLMLGAETSATLRNRDNRIERCLAALRSGWPPDEAIIFAGSKEEWESVCEKAGIPGPMEDSNDRN